MTDAKPDRDADDYVQDNFGNQYMLIGLVLRVEVAYLGQRADSCRSPVRVFYTHSESRATEEVDR